MKTFEKNKYCRLYFKLISNRKSLGLPEGHYYERHHIFPSSLGGPNSKRNLIRLSAREHFLCHFLLTKMCKKDIHFKKMVYAFNMMGWNSSGKRYVNSRLYESNKSKFSKQIKNDHGRNKKISETLKKQRIGKGNPMFGKDFSKSHRENISKALTGRVRSEEERKSISKGRIGVSVEPSLRAKWNISKAARKKNGPRKIRESKKSKKLKRYEIESDLVRTVLFNNTCQGSGKNFNPPLKTLRRAFGEENLEKIINRISPN